MKSHSVWNLTGFQFFTMSLLQKGNLFCTIWWTWAYPVLIAWEFCEAIIRIQDLQEHEKFLPCCEDEEEFALMELDWSSSPQSYWLFLRLDSKINHSCFPLLSAVSHLNVLGGQMTGASRNSLLRRSPRLTSSAVGSQSSSCFTLIRSVGVYRDVDSIWTPRGSTATVSGRGKVTAMNRARLERATVPSNPDEQEKNSSDEENYEDDVNHEDTVAEFEEIRARTWD